MSCENPVAQCWSNVGPASQAMANITEASGFRQYSNIKVIRNDIGISSGAFFVELESTPSGPRVKNYCCGDNKVL